MEQTLTMQYIEIFSSVKNENFMRKNDIFEHVFFSQIFSKHRLWVHIRNTSQVFFYMFACFVFVKNPNRTK